MSKQDIAVRFARETAEHQMLILHDDGLYRHIKFRSPKHGWAYWFELITTPGTLTFRGDGESYVFYRDTDMFEFFHGSAWNGRPNLGYWMEKITSSQDTIRRHDQDLLAAEVCATVAEYYEGKPLPAGLRDAIQEEILDALVGDDTYDRQLVDDFTFYVNDDDRYAVPRVAPDFEFHDVWELQSTDYAWWYEWACQAIVWGVDQYYTHKNVSRWERIKRTVLRRNDKPISCTPLVLTADERARAEQDRDFWAPAGIVDVALPKPAEAVHGG